MCFRGRNLALTVLYVPSLLDELEALRAYVSQVRECVREREIEGERERGRERHERQERQERQERRERERERASAHPRVSPVGVRGEEGTL